MIQNLQQQQQQPITTMTSTDQPLYATNPEKWLEENAHGPELLIVVIFQGVWNKYDKHYLHKLGQFHQNVTKKENALLVAWTSQGMEGAKQADEQWELTKSYGYSQVIGDETNALAKHLIEDEVLPDLVIKTIEEAKVQEYINTTPNATYPNGIVMPAILWYAHHGSIVFEWSHPCTHPDPKVMCGGPLRPDPLDMWNQVLKRKKALDHGDAVMPSRGTNVKMCTSDFDVQLSECIVL